MGAPRQVTAPPARAVRPRAEPTQVSVASKGGLGARKPSLRFVRNTCRGAPRWCCVPEAAAAPGATGGWVAAEVDYQLCGGEAWERALRCVTGLGGSLHSICSCKTSVTSHSAVRITTHPPPDQSQPLKRTARSTVIARPGVELQSQTSMSPL